MAADALRRQSEPVELADRPYLMTGVAVHHRVCANQGKAVLVLVDVVNRNRPAVGVVA